MESVETEDFTSDFHDSLFKEGYFRGSSDLATFATFRNRNEVKKAVQSFLILGFNKSAIRMFQSDHHSLMDLPPKQIYQFKNAAIIGAIIGVLMISGYYLMTMDELTGSPAIVKFAAIAVGGLFGAACGSLIGIGSPESAAKRYAHYLQSGGYLLSVHCENPQQSIQSKAVLVATGGQDIQLKSELNTWDKKNLELIEIYDIENLGAKDTLDH